MKNRRVDGTYLTFAELKARGDKVRAELQNLQIKGQSLMAESQGLRTHANEADLLTPREREVLKCIAEGHATKEVAARLGITFKTAACHRFRLMEKLGIYDTATLVRYAIRKGIVEPRDARISEWPTRA